jgi:hypothetical protein
VEPFSIKDKEWCSRMVAVSKVVAGWSWGSLPRSGRLEWHRRGCDSIIPPVSVEKAGEFGKFCVDAKGKPLGANLIECNEAWCRSAMRQFNVVNGVSWGKLPVSSRSEWNQRGCGLLSGRAANLVQQRYGPEGESSSVKAGSSSQAAERRHKKNK